MMGTGDERTDARAMTATPRETSAFEAIKHTDDDGAEYWSARELGKLLGYAKWQHFAEVIEEAEEVCRANGGDAAVSKNFTAIGKVSGKRGPAQQDYRLTRHACYLIAESADGRKPQVAFAKMYFALTTERYELLATSEEARQRLRAEDAYGLWSLLPESDEAEADE